MFTDTVSGSLLILGAGMAWRDLPEDRRTGKDPMSLWNSLTDQGRQMYLASAQRLRDALVDVEDAWDPRVDDVVTMA